MKSSVKSTALEPGPDDFQGTGLNRVIHIGKRQLPVYGLVVLLIGLLALFSLLRPDTFPTYLNFRVIAFGKSVPMLLALAVSFPMIAGKIDLSVGYAVGLWHMLAFTLQIRYGVPWWATVLIVIVAGGLVGLFNALLVELAQVDAFIATLATGQVLFAITQWHSGNRQVTDTKGAIPAIFKKLGTWEFLRIPGPFLVAMLIAAVMYVVLDYTPIGRYLYVAGANPRAAELSGISRRKYVSGAFVISGMIAAFAGVIYAARTSAAQANVGPDLLLPALAAAFLGSTTIRPGRVNAWGTVVGIVIAAAGISGLTQVFPNRSYLDQLFNGLTLMAAIVIASWAGRRRLSVRERVASVTTVADDPPTNQQDQSSTIRGETT
jgi:ribose transport system permease protein